MAISFLIVIKRKGLAFFAYEFWIENDLQGGLANLGRGVTTFMIIFIQKVVSG
jgi:hypothetical protein